MASIIILASSRTALGIDNLTVITVIGIDEIKIDKKMIKGKLDSRSQTANRALEMVRSRGCDNQFQAAYNELEEMKMQIDETENPQPLYEKFDIALANLLNLYIPKFLKDELNRSNLPEDVVLTKLSELYIGIRQKLSITGPILSNESEELNRLCRGIPKCENKAINLKANLAEKLQITSAIMSFASVLGTCYSVINSSLGMPSIQPVSPITFLISSLFFSLINAYTHRHYDQIIKQSKYDIYAMNDSEFLEITKMIITTITPTSPVLSEQPSPEPIIRRPNRDTEEHGSLASPQSAFRRPAPLNLSTGQPIARRLSFSGTSPVMTVAKPRDEVKTSQLCK